MTDYFIKPGYRPNLVQATLDPSPSPSYWNATRIAEAMSWQHDVYAMAMRRIAAGASSLLDVGCGPPRKLAAMLPRTPVRVHLVDQPNTAPLARELLPAATFTAADLERIHLDLGERFALVLCADVLEHLLDPDPCLGFMQRHLAADGTLIVSTPERDVLRGRDCDHSPHPQHVREWNRAEFRAYLESRGLRVHEQRLLPQRRTPALRRAWGALRHRCGRPPSWYSCQVAVCGLR
jgi:SAM-dependent methyltransferase